jgi:hypothetical protein
MAGVSLMSTLSVLAGLRHTGVTIVDFISSSIGPTSEIELAPFLDE